MTVEVGAGLNVGYYTAKDSENRICFTSTDATTVIQQCFNVGGELAFGTGTFYTTDTLSITTGKNVKISGMNTGSTVIEQTVAAKDLISVTSGSLTIEHIRLNQNGGADDGNIISAYRSNLYVNDVKFYQLYNYASYALNLTDQYTPTISDVYISTRGSGILLNQVGAESYGNGEFRNVHIYINPYNTGYASYGLKITAADTHGHNALTFIELNIVGHSTGTGTNVTAIDATYLRNSAFYTLGIEATEYAFKFVNCASLTIDRYYIPQDSVPNLFASGNEYGLSRNMVFSGPCKYSYTLSSIGSTYPCQNGTWIATGLSLQANRWDLSLPNSGTSGVVRIPPQVIASNTTHVQIVLYYIDPSTGVQPVGAGQAATVNWKFWYDGVTV
jgi:hypothetical protein